MPDPQILTADDVMAHLGSTRAKAERVAEFDELRAAHSNETDIAALMNIHHTTANNYGRWANVCRQRMGLPQWRRRRPGPPVLPGGF